VLCLGLLNQGCVTATEYERLKDQLANANETIDLKDQRIEELDHERLVYEEESLALKDEMARYREHSEKADEIINDLRNQLENTPSNTGETTLLSGIEMFKAEKGTGIRFDDEVLFDFASDQIKPQAKQVLDIIVSKLRESDTPLEILGHTDSVPVAKAKTKAKYPRGNIELSASRALQVWEYLKSKGISEKRMKITGCGPTQPLVPNDTPENRRKNRRVEIVLMN
jgi:chemotaxis protein MotB